MKIYILNLIFEMESITIGQFAYLAVYMWYKLVQAFLYAWAGEEIKIAVYFLI